LNKNLFQIYSEYQKNRRFCTKRGWKVKKSQNGRAAYLVEFIDSIAKPLVGSLCSDTLGGPDQDEKCNKLEIPRRMSNQIGVKKKRARTLFFSLLTGVASII